MYRVFLTTAWTGSNTPFEHELPNGETALVYQTLPQAYDAANDSGDIIQPAPPGTPGFCFYGSDGEPLQTVVVDLGANWTITKSITLQGDWARLRLDGGGNVRRIVIQAGATFRDVDIVRIKNASSCVFVNTSAAVTFERCVVAGCQRTSVSYANAPAGIAATAAINMTFAATDCAFFGCNSAAFTHGSASSTISLTRCVVDYPNELPRASLVDSVNIGGKTQEQVDAIGFVKAPKVYDASNPGYYTDGTPWTMNDWTEDKVDLRLLSTSPYATGGTSVTSGQKVYDLAGMPRKVGGALGAYECLSDVTHYLNCGALWCKIEYEDDSAPRITNITPHTSRNSYLSSVFAIYGNFSGVLYRTSYRPNEWRAFTAVRNYVTVDGQYYEVAYGTVDGGPTSGVTKVTRLAASENGAVPVMTFGSQYGWDAPTRDAFARSAPSASSVCYVGDNRELRSTGASVGKVYVGGWARVKLGDATIGELVLGLNAEATTTGKVTLKNETATSAAIFSQLKPTAPAVVTFKECAISDPASE